MLKNFKCQKPFPTFDKLGKAITGFFLNVLLSYLLLQMLVESFSVCILYEFTCTQYSILMLDEDAHQPFCHKLPEQLHAAQIFSLIWMD